MAFFTKGIVISFVAGIAAVTADDVLAIANEILQEKNKSVSWVVPKK